jgi:hypothetical protein
MFLVCTAISQDPSSKGDSFATRPLRDKSRAAFGAAARGESWLNERKNNPRAFFEPKRGTCVGVWPLAGLEMPWPPGVPSLP